MKEIFSFFKKHEYVKIFLLGALVPLGVYLVAKVGFILVYLFQLVFSSLVSLGAISSSFQDGVFLLLASISIGLMFVFFAWWEDTSWF